jgi:orotate phosphoribosyltransferase
VSAPPAELSPAEVVRLFRDCGALLEGHFLLSSDMHSPYYL